MALAVTVVVLNVRFDNEWSIGVHLVYTAAAAALAIALALSVPAGSGSPPAWHSTLFVASFVLGFGTLANLADVLGADDDLSSGTVFWVGFLLASLMFWLARRYDSGIAALLDALTTLVVVIAFVDWAFDPDGAGTFRWVLLFTALAMAAYGLMGGEEERHRRVGWVNAAGVALLAIPGTFGLEAFGGLLQGGGEVEAGTGWELVMLGGGAALIAYTATLARSGPAYLGVLNLAAFVLLAGEASDDGPSLIGWPLLLLLGTAALLAVALRPRT